MDSKADVCKKCGDKMNCDGDLCTWCSGYEDEQAIRSQVAVYRQLHDSQYARLHEWIAPGSQKLAAKRMYLMRRKVRRFGRWLDRITAWPFENEQQVNVAFVVFLVGLGVPCVVYNLGRFLGWWR